MRSRTIIWLVALIPLPIVGAVGPASSDDGTRSAAWSRKGVESAPAAPSTVTIERATGEELTVAWERARDRAGSVMYDIRVDDGPPERAARSPLTLRSLRCGRSYVISIAAVDQAGRRSIPVAVTASTAACPDRTPPTAPTGFHQESTTESGAILRWTASTDDVGVVTYETFSGTELVSSAPEPSVTLTGLSCGRAYDFDVTALDAAGNRSPRARASVRTIACEPAPRTRLELAVRSFDGGANNLRNPDWGKAGTVYTRVAPPSYADGIAAQVSGPPARYVSNRIFNDTSQNLFSENGVSQWGFAWGQFLDHTFGLRQEEGGENAPIAFDGTDPLESFANDLGAIPFSRTPAAPGTGVTAAREQVNTVSSYIDGSNVYGDDAGRLEWLREGPVDGRLANNGARLLLSGGYLPRADARGSTAAPRMALMGRLMLAPQKAMVAGDVRANENIALTATHTLFALEHNRIVNALPSRLPEELKFQIARRVVGAEQQYITYEEFLPTLGVRLSRYRGYDPRVNGSLSNEFAVVGYRAHSMIHGELEPIAPAGTWTQEQLEAFEQQGIEVETEGDELVLVIPLNLAFGNPDLLQAVGLAPVLRALGSEPEYRNDEQIDNQLRSVLFQIPKPSAPDPAACMDGPALPDCFAGVLDLAALDIERGRDHGMPSYNALRRAYGLPTKRSFTSVTGESTDRFPADPEIDRRNPIDDPDILDFVRLLDAEGNPVPLDSPEAQEDAVTGIRRTTLAARLKAIYGSVDSMDAFVGMASERHLPGVEFGELQLAIWKKQFEALRDGDRFFYEGDGELRDIERRYGVTYRHTLAEIIELNTGLDVQPKVFEAPEE
jgi:hypothetical protein